TGARGQLMVLADKAPQRVFAGRANQITVLLHNAGGRPAAVQMRTRLHQATSSTTILLDESPWKRLEILEGQTVLESAVLNFPAARSETCFIIQWVEGSSTVAGTTEVLAYPLTLLRDLKSLAGGEGLGVCDPQSELKPLLKT